MSQSQFNNVDRDLPVNELYLSAPGKAILFGEHSVVYGRTAVAGSIDLRTHLTLYTSNDGRIFISLPDIGVERTWMLRDFLLIAEELDDVDVSDTSAPSLELLVPLARRITGTCQTDDLSSGVQNLAILAFLFVLLGVTQRKRNLPAVKITVRFKLPSCVGLGSSGAYCVCIAAALLCSAGLIPRPTAQTTNADCLTWADSHLEIIRKWSASAESLIHGRASGLDAAYPDVVGNIFNAMDAISVEAIKILEKSCDSVHTDSSNSSSTEDEKKSLSSNVDIASSNDDFAKLNDLARINNHLLIALGVGHPKIDQICTILARYGIHPKMTGAGGGGSAYAFLKPDISPTLLDMIENEVTACGFEMWQPSLGGDGVVLHMKKFDCSIFEKPIVL